MKCLGEERVKRLEEGRLLKSLGQQDELLEETDRPLELLFASGDYEGPPSKRCQGLRSSQFQRRGRRVSEAVEPKILFLPLVVFC